MRIEHIEPDYPAINKKVEAAFTCAHKATIRCKKTKAGEQIEIRDQCQRCGEKVGHAIRKVTMSPAQIDELPPWEEQIIARFIAERNRFHLETLNREKQRLIEDWRRRYDRYLDSPEWTQRRHLVLLRAQGICEGCRIGEAKEVHHLTYVDVGEEFLFQLVALCRKCHGRCHQPEPPGYVPPATQSPISPVQTGGVP